MQEAVDWEGLEWAAEWADEADWDGIDEGGEDEGAM